ncbi:MAG: hypothetical protein AN484_28780, partial [Aphanizomenon flos-aquae WA102]
GGNKGMVVMTQQPMGLGLTGQSAEVHFAKVQRVGEKGNCLLMYDSGTQLSLVSLAYVMRAGLRRIDKSRLEVDVLGGQTQSYGKYLLVLEDCAGAKHEILVRAVAQIGKAYIAKCPDWIGEILPGLEGQEAELTQLPGNVDVMLGLDQVRYFPVESGRYQRLTYQVSGFRG